MLLASNDVYSSKRPYTILVPKGVRHNGEFMLLVDDAPSLALSVELSHDETRKEVDAEKGILLSIGSELFMSCKYASANAPRAKICEFAICNGRRFLTSTPTASGIREFCCRPTVTAARRGFRLGIAVNGVILLRVIAPRSRLQEVAGGARGLFRCEKRPLGAAGKDERGRRGTKRRGKQQITGT